MVLEAKCHRRLDGNRNWATIQAHRARGAAGQGTGNSTKERNNNYIYLMRDYSTLSQLCL